MWRCAHCSTANAHCCSFPNSSSPFLISYSMQHRHAKSFWISNAPCALLINENKRLARNIALRMGTFSERKWMDEWLHRRNIYKYREETNLNLFKLNPYSWLTPLNFQFMFSVFLGFSPSHYLSFCRPVPAPAPPLYSMLMHFVYNSIPSLLVFNLRELNTFSVVVRCQNSLMAFLTSHILNVLCLGYV